MSSGALRLGPGFLALAPVSLVSLLVSLLVSNWATAMPNPDAAPEPAAPERERPALEDTAAGQAPAGVDIDLPLQGGEWQVSYRFLGRWQSGTLIGSTDVSPVVVAAAYPSYERLPRRRDTAIHIVGLEWAPHERVTLVVRLPVLSIDEASTSFTASPVRDTRVDGIGDLSFGVQVPFMRKGEESTSVSLMITAPTGSIRQLSPDFERSYPIQFGSGSWKLSPALNYRGRWHDLSWGGKLAAHFALNHNSLDYALGTHWNLTAWLGWSLADWISASARAEWNRHGNIRGADSGIERPFTSPSQDPFKRHGHRIDLGPGINVRLPCCSHQRFAVEAMFPVFQDLEGPQLKNTWVLNAAWRMTF